MNSKHSKISWIPIFKMNNGLVEGGENTERKFTIIQVFTSHQPIYLTLYVKLGHFTCLNLENCQKVTGCATPTLVSTRLCSAK
jgi:hypothetical protein